MTDVREALQNHKYHHITDKDCQYVMTEANHLLNMATTASEATTIIATLK